MRELNPKSVRPPFARYSHGVEVPSGWRIVRTSGQLGIAPSDVIPQSAFDQATLCFAAIAEILSEAGMTACDVAHISGFVTDRDHFEAYMQARDNFMEGTGRLPASTLLIVSGFTRPEFKVEVEVMAAAP